MRPPSTLRRSKRRYCWRRWPSKPAYVVLNAVPPRSGIGREAAEGLAGRGAKVAPRQLTQRAAFAHSVIDGRTAQEFEPQERPPRKSATSTSGYVVVWTCPHADMPERQRDTMPKRPSLFASRNAPAADAAAEITSEAVSTPTSPTSTRPPSRAGKRVLSIYLDPLAWKQLRQLALDADTTTQALGEEAVNLLFEKHRLNRSA